MESNVHEECNAEVGEIEHNLKLKFAIRIKECFYV